MTVLDTLNTQLLRQEFPAGEAYEKALSQYKMLAQNYASLESCIAVLSDLQTNTSYVYYGAIVQALDIETDSSEVELNSIWEEAIFKAIHPDDLVNKHTVELQFLAMMRKLPPQQRTTYHVHSLIRMRDKENNFRVIKHRMYYVYVAHSSPTWLAICLYGLPEPGISSDGLQHYIFNAVSGQVIVPDQNQLQGLLSAREKEVLQLIKSGNLSKEIAHSLSISVNTVNRHRQNILEKLRVKNSMEACLIADKLQLW
ncbi:response regulator transcription factor [Sphingobacterium sp. Mn56C]|uniref:helix-turn-helix transcriptional regulator n=1 Tax=Sphingobacterium sp. Mn56C TaxID=3395261 RepID=UPI003BCF4993